MVALAINAGGDAYTSKDGIRYLADDHFVAGNIYSTTNAIDLTDDDVIYQTERWNTDSLDYEIPLTDGVYDVVLKFAEIFHDAADLRTFDVLLEGERVVEALDIVREVGASTAYDVRFEAVSVQDGALSISLTGAVDNPKISAIVVYREPNGGDTPTAPKRSASRLE